jgi:hypothetical protein
MHVDDEAVVPCASPGMSGNFYATHTLHIIISYMGENGPHLQTGILSITTQRVDRDDFLTSWVG